MCWARGGTIVQGGLEVPLGFGLGRAGREGWAR